MLAHGVWVCGGAYIGYCVSTWCVGVWGRAYIGYCVSTWASAYLPACTVAREALSAYLPTCLPAYACSSTVARETLHARMCMWHHSCLHVTVTPNPFACMHICVARDTLPATLCLSACVMAYMHTQNTA